MMKKKNIYIINYISQVIKKKNLLSPGQTVLLTISGGQDSICLLFIFLQLKTQWKLNIGFLYCQHLWQLESFYTICLVAKLAYLFKLPFYSSITIKNINTEEKARNWRYKIFKKISDNYNYNIITTGHTATDRIETCFLQFIRGTSPKGIFSLKWIQENFKENEKMFFPTFFLILQECFFDCFLFVELSKNVFWSDVFVDSCLLKRCSQNFYFNQFFLYKISEPKSFFGIFRDNQKFTLNQKNLFLLARQSIVKKNNSSLQVTKFESTILDQKPEFTQRFCNQNLKKKILLNILVKKNKIQKNVYSHDLNLNWFIISSTTRKTFSFNKIDSEKNSNKIEDNFNQIFIFKRNNSFIFLPQFELLKYSYSFCLCNFYSGKSKRSKGRKSSKTLTENNFNPFWTKALFDKNIFYLDERKKEKKFLSIKQKSNLIQNWDVFTIKWMFQNPFFLMIDFTLNNFNPWFSSKKFLFFLSCFPTIKNELNHEKKAKTKVESKIEANSFDLTRILSYLSLRTFFFVPRNKRGQKRTKVEFSYHLRWYKRNRVFYHHFFLCNFYSFILQSIGSRLCSEVCKSKSKSQKDMQIYSSKENITIPSEFINSKKLFFFKQHVNLLRISLNFFSVLKQKKKYYRSFLPWVKWFHAILKKKNLNKTQYQVYIGFRRNRYRWKNEINFLVSKSLKIKKIRPAIVNKKRILFMQYSKFSYFQLLKFLYQDYFLLLLLKVSIFNCSSRNTSKFSTIKDRLITILFKSKIKKKKISYLKNYTIRNFLSSLKKRENNKWFTPNEQICLFYNLSSINDEKSKTLLKSKKLFSSNKNLSKNNRNFTRMNDSDSYHDFGLYNFYSFILHFYNCKSKVYKSKSKRSKARWSKVFTYKEEKLFLIFLLTQKEFSFILNNFLETTKPKNFKIQNFFLLVPLVPSEMVEKFIPLVPSEMVRDLYSSQVKNYLLFIIFLSQKNSHKELRKVLASKTKNSCFPFLVVNKQQKKYSSKNYISFWFSSWTRTLFESKSDFQKINISKNSNYSFLTPKYRKISKKFLTISYWKIFQQNFSIYQNYNIFYGNSDNLIQTQSKFLPTINNLTVINWASTKFLIPFFFPFKNSFFIISKLKNKRVVIRPILFLNRFDLKKLCEYWQLPLYPDKSNQKIKYYRNRIRKQLLPTLRFFFNPKIDTILFQFTEISNAESFYLDFVTKRLLTINIQKYQKNKIRKSTKFVVSQKNYQKDLRLFYHSNWYLEEINIYLFQLFPLAIQRRILKNIFDSTISDGYRVLNQEESFPLGLELCSSQTKKIKFSHIEKILKFIHKKKIKKYSLLKLKNFPILTKFEPQIFLPQKDYNDSNTFLYFQKWYSDKNFVFENIKTDSIFTSFGSNQILPSKRVNYSKLSWRSIRESYLILVNLLFFFEINSFKNLSLGELEIFLNQIYKLEWDNLSVEFKKTKNNVSKNNFSYKKFYTQPQCFFTPNLGIFFLTDKQFLFF